MKRQYVTADVFTTQRFEGNPVAVVLDAQGLSTRQMQHIAAEFAYTETTFVLAPSSPAHTARVRIFTPSREIPFAGHPNIGTAYVLAKQAEKQGAPFPDHITFEQRAGEVPIRILKEDGVVTGAELIAPEPLSRFSQVSPQAAALCLSLNPDDIRTQIHPPQVASVGLPFLIVELVSREALRACAPNPNGFKALMPLDGATSVYAYTRDRDAHESASDIQARMFTPRMTEDPATGSATAATAALLASIVQAEKLSLRVAQGTDMGRPSLLMVDVQVTAKGSVVRLGGHCVEVLEGTLFLAGEDE